jgi:hypothetical protein
MTVRAGMDYKHCYVSIHGRDSGSGHRTIPHLPIPILSPKNYRSSHPNRPQGRVHPWYLQGKPFLVPPRDTSDGSSQESQERQETKSQIEA